MLADPKTYLAALTEELHKPWPTNRLANIVCHGHSVPAGYFKTPVVDSFHAYPHLLHRALKERLPHAVLNVIVTAIGGEESESGAKRFEAEVLCHRPDLLLIDYSLNDRRIGLERAALAWSQMIVAAQKRKIPLILCTPTLD
jgi:acyl-CoA thioesterase I